MTDKIPYTVLLPACAVLVVLPFLVIPVLNGWADSLPVSIGVGMYEECMVPGSTMALWGLIGVLKILTYIGAFLGFIGLFASLGRLADAKSIE
jgi:hypothetical protein